MAKLLTRQQALAMVKKMGDELDRRQPDIKLWNDYVVGEHNLAFASERFQAAFGGLFQEFADNWCGVVAGAPPERMSVRGFRFGDGTKVTARGRRELPQQADAVANEIWQRNGMDAQSKLAFNETHIKARSFAMVWADDDDRPEITIEDPTEVIISYEAGSRRRRKAMLKRWVDDDGIEHATLQRPDELWKFSRRTSASGTSRLHLPPSYTADNGWVDRSDVDPDVDEGPEPNPFGIVMGVELANRERLVDAPTPEHIDVIPLQNAVNKLFLDMMVAAEAGAFPARWGAGLDVPKDPKTGQELPDADFWRGSLAKMMRATDPQAKFGNFEAADLRNFVVGIEMVVQHIAALTKTPPNYLLAKLINLSADAMLVAESGLVAKTIDKTVFTGESLEEMMRLGFRVLDDPRQDAWWAETVWANVQYKTEAQLWDAIVKRKAAGVPWRQLMEDADYTPAQIDRMERWLEEDARRAGMGLGIDPPRPADEPTDTADDADLERELELAGS